MMFATPDPIENAQAALTAWEERPDATLLVSCQGAYVVESSTNMVRLLTSHGYEQTSPEEIEARLNAA